MQQARERRFLVIVLIGLMSLFFLQLLSELIQGIFASSLMTLSVNQSIFASLFLLSSILLVVFGQRLSPLFILIFGELTILFRILGASASPGYNIVFAGLGVACFLLFFPSHLHFIKDSNRNTKGVSFGIGFSLAVLLLITFKTLNSSIDITLYGPYKWIGWVLAGIAFIVLPIVVLGGDSASKSRNRQIFGKKSDRPNVFLPALGLFSVVALVYFIFASPAVVTRWVEGDYSMITAFQVLAIIIYAVNKLLNPNPESSLIKPVLFFWNFVFIVFLLAFVIRLQPSFPVQESGYPYFAESITTVDQVLLYIILFLSPVFFVNVSVFSAQIIKTSVSIARVGFGFFSACAIFLMLIFSHVFLTTYDYVPVVGPFFRDKLWFVIFLACLGMLIPVIASRHELTRDRGIRFSSRDRFMLGLLFTVLTCVILFGIPESKPISADAASQKSLKVMTYNIQQGYNKFGKKSYLEQLELIKSVNPDILALQETDSVRVAGGNSDIVRYYADKLNMYSYNGPTPVAGTFGIALLSRFPIVTPRTFFMYSEGEQTATIQGKLKVGDQIINIYATHLGNDGDMVQQKAILDLLAKKKNIILLGDFNFNPDSEQYYLTTSTLSDSWLVHQQSLEVEASQPGKEKDDRIDHIFVSPELKISSSRFIQSDHSDHPALVTDIQIN